MTKLFSSMHRFSLLLCALSLSLALHAADPDDSGLMSSAARNFLTSLDDAGRAKCKFAFDSDERLNWHFVPKARNGIRFTDLAPSQSVLAHAFLASAFSSHGMVKLGTIMSLESVLLEMESKTDPARATAMRVPGNYYLSFFGEPAADKPWGWRLEGHHISVNATVINGEVLVSTPIFLGVNPEEVREGPFTGLRALAVEQDLGRALLLQLDDAQKAKAILDPVAPPDVFSGNKRKVEFEDPPKGLAFAEMNEAQRATLHTLIDEYLSLMAPYLHERRREKVAAMKPADWDAVRFAWMGSAEPGQGNYYRIQAREFLIEFDNTQNNANHSHTTWRDYNGDFGLDLLAIHHQNDHADSGK